MSLVVMMVVGYFEPGEYLDSLHRAPSRPVTEDEVAQLDALCRSILGEHHKRPLAESLKDGVVEIHGIVVSYWMYAVACIAHEVFGMNAVDVAHRHAVYPHEDYDLETWRQGRTLNEEQEHFYQRMLREEQAKRQLRDRVRAWVAESRQDPGIAREAAANRQSS